VLHVVLHFENEAVSQLWVDGSGVDQSRSSCKVLKLTHLVVELDGVLGGVLFVERKTHGDTHPEVLRNLQWITVTTLDGVAVVEGDNTDVLEQVIVAGVNFSCEGVEVEQFGQSRVEQTFLDAALHVLCEVVAVQLLQLFRGGEVSEYTLVDGLEQQARGDDVEGRVVLDVLQGDLDDRLVELLGGDAVEQGQLELARDLGDPRDLVGKTLGRALDRQVDLVGVVRLTASIALHHGDAAHVPTLPLGACSALSSRGRCSAACCRKKPGNPGFSR